MEGAQYRGCVFRIKQCALDLLDMRDDLMIEDGDEISWELMGDDLLLKSTFLFCDLSKVISIAGDDQQKETLTQLGNIFFSCMEELQHAVRNRSITLTKSCYDDVAVALQDVLAAMPPPSSPPFPSFPSSP